MHALTLIFVHGSRRLYYIPTRFKIMATFRFFVKTSRVWMDSWKVFESNILNDKLNSCCWTNVSVPRKSQRINFIKNCSHCHQSISTHQLAKTTVQNRIWTWKFWWSLEKGKDPVMTATKGMVMLLSLRYPQQCKSTDIISSLLANTVNGDGVCISCFDLL